MIDTTIMFSRRLLSDLRLRAELESLLHGPVRPGQEDQSQDVQGTVAESRRSRLHGRWPLAWNTGETKTVSIKIQNYFADVMGQILKIQFA